jgi:hypothetical protein
MSKNKDEIKINGSRGKKQTQHEKRRKSTLKNTNTAEHANKRPLILTQFILKGNFKFSVMCSLFVVPWYRRAMCTHAEEEGRRKRQPVGKPRLGTNINSFILAWADCVLI